MTLVLFLMEDIVDNEVLLICIIDLNSYLQSIYIKHDKEKLELVGRSPIVTLKKNIQTYAAKHNATKIHLFGFDGYVQELKNRLNKNLFNKNIEIEVN